VGKGVEGDRRGVNTVYICFWKMKPAEIIPGMEGRDKQE
jgi:hypothetical protein